MPRISEKLNKIRKIEATTSAYDGETFDSDESIEEEIIRVSTPVRSTDSVSSPPPASFILTDGGEEESEAQALGDNNEDDFDNGIMNDGAWSDDEPQPEPNGSDHGDDDRENHEKLWRWIRSNESCKLSIDDFNAILAGIQSYHKLPDTAMDVFCKLLSACLPKENGAPSSYSSAMKQFRQVVTETGQSITYVCSSKLCNQELNKLFDNCRNPACPLFNQRQNASGFLRLHIKPQIEALVRIHFLDIMRFLCSNFNQSGTVGDIPTTPAYAEFGENPSGRTLFISLILSSDGAQAFKCGRSSFWPYVAIIAELPPTVRVSIENVIGLGFWVGRGEKAKPDWSAFLPKIITELNILKDGFDLEIDGHIYRICIRILATIFDLPAQASIWGHKQFNGNFGCIQCHHPGTRQGPLCLWPKLDPKPLKKNAAFFEDAWKSLAMGQKEYFGVTKISPIATICNPATVNIFDSMHLVYRGNAQLILNRLFTSQPQKWSPLFSSGLISQLDHYISKVRFPHSFDRKIPSLRTLGSFKASEIKNLLVYVILPITAPYVEQIPDYWHWIAIYVDAIRLLSQPIVSDKDIDRAQLFIDTWQKLVPELCHENSQTFNAHAAGHLPDQVKRFGPLWSISTFAFEGFNGHFSRFIKASKGALLQLGRRFTLQQAAYQYLAKKVRNGEENADVIQNLFPNLCQRWKPRLEENRWRLLNELPTCPDQQIMEFLHREFLECEDSDFCFASRVTSGSQVFHSIQHSAKTASIVRYSDAKNDVERAYGEVQLCLKVNNDIFLIVKKYKCLAPTNILQGAPPTIPSLFELYDDRVYGSFYWVVEIMNVFDLVRIFDVICTAVLIETADSCVITDVLPFEHD